MSDDFEPFATAGSGKSEAEVAFDLLNKLKGQGVWGERNMPAILDMYAECLDAVRGYRAYEGQTRIELAVRQMVKVEEVQPLTQAPAQSQAQLQAAQAQAQPQAQPPAPPAVPLTGTANPVQAQQAQIQQQLYKQS